MRQHRTKRLLGTIGTLLILGAAPAAAQSPPGQPSSGPGGSAYPHASYTVTSNGSGNLQYWVFQPASPKPASAPLIVFNHGYGGMDPVYYQAWLEHLVRRGNVVVYPRYQATLLTLPRNFTGNAITAVKNAISWLQASSTRVQPQLDRFAIAGHSYGGVVSVNMAHRWQSSGLPQPKALFPVEPWWDNMDTLTGIPSTILMNCLVADEDTLAEETGCDQIWARTAHVPLANRDYVWMFSDRYGTPDLLAEHDQATTGGGGNRVVNALDWYGTWKILDGLTDCAFYGTNCAYALGDTPQHRWMGTWSDGTPVFELAVFDLAP
jgi:pimeloyl-ACP methyl ester carboxylesterase